MFPPNPNCCFDCGDCRVPFPDNSDCSNVKWLARQGVFPQQVLQNSTRGPSKPVPEADDTFVEQHGRRSSVKVSLRGMIRFVFKGTSVLIL